MAELNLRLRRYKKPLQARLQTAFLLRVTAFNECRNRGNAKRFRGHLSFGDFSGSLFLVSDVEKALTDSILILKNHLKVFLDISFTI